MITRTPSHHYQDPLALVWRRCAEALGFGVALSAEVYASSDGLGRILLGTATTLDADDNPGQMLLHELCHALVQGPKALALPDWGLDNTSDRDVWCEHACLRLQAWLTARWGLRDFMAPTTDFRLSFWERLPEDPFAPVPGEPVATGRASIQAARKAAYQASQPPWVGPLTRALAATRALAEAVLPGPAAATATASSATPSLWATLEPLPALHPVGVAPYAAEAADGRARRCVDCAWAFRSGTQWRCRHAPRRQLDPESLACQRFEPAGSLDCQQCAACCREAYDSVEVGRREAVVRLHPELVSERHGHLALRRAGGDCAALEHTPEGSGDVANPGDRPCYSCHIYADRPRNCREFAAGGVSCLDARRRLGYSL
jgi:hypothetical protein